METDDDDDSDRPSSLHSLLDACEKGDLEAVKLIVERQKSSHNNRQLVTVQHWQFYNEKPYCIERGILYLNQALYRTTLHMTDVHRQIGLYLVQQGAMINSITNYDYHLCTFLLGLKSSLLKPTVLSGALDVILIWLAKQPQCFCFYHHWKDLNIKQTNVIRCSCPSIRQWYYAAVYLISKGIKSRHIDIVKIKTLNIIQSKLLNIGAKPKELLISISFELHSEVTKLLHIHIIRKKIITTLLHCHIPKLICKVVICKFIAFE